MSEAPAREPAASGERFADYFDLQLRLAALMAERTPVSLRDALGLYTNLRRRFGLFEADDPAWLEYLDELEAGPRGAWLGLTLARQRRAPEFPRPQGQVPFGCFACDPPDVDGALRIHFSNREIGTEPGPLSAARTRVRLDELREMFSFVRGEFPGARSVLGNSWLYNLEAYRRLFPPEYGASCRVPDGPVRLGGTSTWGQMVDHRGLVRPEARARFLACLETLDVEQPWLAFPLRALRATAPVEAFFNFYGL